MRNIAVGWSGLLLVCGSAAADGEEDSRNLWRHRANESAGRAFERIATLPNYLDNADFLESTVSEIIASTADGRTLVYTDSPLEEIGFIDIALPHVPISAGKLAMGGERRSVAVLGNTLALAAVDTTDD